MFEQKFNGEKNDGIVNMQYASDINSIVQREQNRDTFRKHCSKLHVLIQRALLEILLTICMATFKNNNNL